MVLLGDQLTKSQSMYYKYLNFFQKVYFVKKKIRIYNI